MSPTIRSITLSDHSSSSVANTAAKEITCAILELYTRAQRGRRGRARRNGHCRIARLHQTCMQNNIQLYYPELKVSIMKSLKEENLWKLLNVITTNKELEPY